MKDLTKEWVQKAEGDFLVAGREMAAIPPVYDAVCFHAQQCVEKYLKAVLQENNVDLEKTHDLDLLMDACKKYIAGLSDFTEQLIGLSGCAVEVRYPGVESTAEEARACLDTADKTRRLIRGYFGVL